MRTLYVTDLDGTLLNSNDQISQYSMEIINGLVAKGMQFTYATARSLVSASVVAKGLSTTIPVIAYNGALIVNPATGEVISSLSFTGEEAARIREVLQEHGANPLVYAYVDGVERVSYVTGRENEGIRRYLEVRKGDRRFRPLEDETLLYQGNIFYFTCIADREELLPLYEIFKRDGRYRCTLQQELYRPEFFLEIMPEKASKAEAIKRLKEIWHCGKVVSFGDAVNDIPMFEISDECYAVANGVAELKACATGVIASNDEDGVARWLADMEDSTLEESSLSAG
ncbi:MAG: HAD family hydrolase [Lachnospiraceae bacterium]|mgnify:CR=1 FL=1|nr:HAD family hydrolase [Lachnospiraceae bacterium]